MAESAKRSRSLSSVFSRGTRMEVGVHSNFVTGYEGNDAKRSKKEQPSAASIFSDLTGLPMNPMLTTSSSAFAMHAEESGSKSSKSLSDSNIGFKLLKKSGWKEGTGLGVSEQGRLDPLEAKFKSDKRGIGAKENKKQKTDGSAAQASSERDQKSSRKEKNLAKRARKLKAEAERSQEQAFKQEFYREFWPENV